MKVWEIKLIQKEGCCYCGVKPSDNDLNMDAGEFIEVDRPDGILRATKKVKQKKVSTLEALRLEKELREKEKKAGRKKWFMCPNCAETEDD